MDNLPAIRIGIKDKFVSVNDGFFRLFGGRQEFFSETYRPKISKYGCGIVAAINSYLYIAQVNQISKDDFMTLVQDYLDMYPTSKILLNLGVGVLPWQMSSYIQRKCKSVNINVKASWRGREGVSSLYNKMKAALLEDMPVIWAFYNLKSSHRIQFYKYIDGKFKDTYFDEQDKEHKYDDVNSHYVTVTGIIERENNGYLERWVEISSWGSKYYVNYDEYENFVRNAGGILNPLNLVNAYCSNILIIKKR
ncbi:hypothetical protein [Pseudobutyrivibrio xylanivorans]|uniref:Uncharacterized protein n=1 Tax=Pseudobutyrivibrio xylanivorans DSM 14809 TaxID=1123012 RepID=A0A1M6DXY6_PSEXY|nr:hypothetical protein [Pseudobutyrivibrio xylanivorans]SHI77878.1 hypothetical protein SAMN02745725_01069 [Pseudobutyrivibrio xylanivorans DSM 14809]